MPDTVNIAPAPGLPDIAFGTTPVAVALLTADDPSVLSVFGVPQWGAYLGGQPAVIADIVAALDYNKSYSVSDYTIEEGGFASYDKVETPYLGRIRFASGGSPAARQALIESVENIIGDLNFYDLVTSDKVYLNANVVREEYRRTSTEGGASIFAMDVGVQEVRVPSADNLANTADPASADQSNSGASQPQIPTQGQQSAALPYFASGTIPPPTLQ